MFVLNWLTERIEKLSAEEMQKAIFRIRLKIRSVRLFEQVLRIQFETDM
jgi:hypothetical protein